eukprot:7249871-Lingulodinium_polyedra.AAC.1
MPAPVGPGRSRLQLGALQRCGDLSPFTQILQRGIGRTRGGHDARQAWWYSRERAPARAHTACGARRLARGR